MRISIRLPVWLQCMFELFLATYGPMIAAAMLVYALFPTAHFVDASLTFRSFNRILSRPYFPLQITLGALSGYFPGVRLRTPVTFWLWLAPAVFLSFCVFTYRVGVFENVWGVRMDHFFGSKCQPPVCFDQMRCTAPFYTSLAYTLGRLYHGVANREEQITKGTDRRTTNVED